MQQTLRPGLFQIVPLVNLTSAEIADCWPTPVKLVWIDAGPTTRR